MRLPAVAIAAAFACGIALGLHPVVVRNASSRFFLSYLSIFIVVLILTGIALVRIERLYVATSASLLSWVLLGSLGACVAEQPRDADHVISMMEQGRLPMKTPLRWHGRLRDEPTRLPWGYGYELEISGVEFEEALHPARGGLRLSYATHPEGARLPELHAGDEVSRGHGGDCATRLMSFLNAISKLQPCCGPCCSETGALSTGKKRQIFRKRACFMYWLWQACTWGLWRSRFTGWDDGCGSRGCGRCSSRSRYFPLMWLSSNSALQYCGQQ